MRSVLANNWMKALQIASLAMGFLVIGGEIAARYLGCPQPYSALFIYDETLGYRSPANKQVTFAAGEKIYKVAFDENGIADRAGEGDVEVIVLGDGVTAGLELPPEDRIAHQLSRLLGGKGVVNLSVTGYGTIQQALLLEDWLAHNKARPKHVMLVFNLSNDVLDNVREWDGAANPSVSLANHDGVILTPILPSVLHRRAAELYHESTLAAYLSNLKHHPVDAQVSSQLMGLFAPQLSDEMKAALLGTKSGFAKLEQLSQKYAFKLHGAFWVDRGLLGNMGKENIANAMNHIQQQASGVVWNPTVFLSENESKGKAWDDLTLVAGTRHANNLTINIIAQQMQRYLMSRNND